MLWGTRETAVERAVRHATAHRGARRSSGVRDANAKRILALLQEYAAGVPQRLARRPRLWELAERLADAVEGSPDPGHARVHLERFLEAGGSACLRLLLDRAELAAPIATLFGSSDWLSTVLVARPALLEPLLRDPAPRGLSRAALVAEMAAPVRDPELPQPRPAARLFADLRLAQQRELVAVALGDVSGTLAPADVEAALTTLAEACVEAALGFVLPPGSPELEFLVVAMGKLGSRELGYGSDLDLLFLHDAPAVRADPALAQERAERLAQRLIAALETRTAEGFCYAIDTRLRPCGEQGPLVPSLAAFEHHHATLAQAWERQALLRARPLVGSERVARRFEELRRAILARPLPRLAAELDRVRRRMERELAHERPGRRDFKTGRGGLLDLEFAVELLQLRHGAAHPELRQAAPLEVQLDRLAALGLLSRADARCLLAGLGFLRRVSLRLRLVANRSVSSFDEARHPLEVLARALGYADVRDPGSAGERLLCDYERHAGAIRRVYRSVFDDARRRA